MAHMLSRVTQVGGQLGSRGLRRRRWRFWREHMQGIGRGEPALQFETEVASNRQVVGEIWGKWWGGEAAGSG